MADPLAVVSVVASIIQLVDFGTRVLKRLEEYQSNARQIPESFRHIKIELPILLDALRQTKAAIDSGSMHDDTKKVLHAVEGCKTQIEDLDAIVMKVLPAPGDSRTIRSRKAFSSLRCDGKVKKITTIVRGYIQALTYHAATTSSILQKPLADQNPSCPAASSTVPFRRDPDFIDRNVLVDIKEKLREPAARVAIVGLGGVG